MEPNLHHPYPVPARLRLRAGVAVVLSAAVSVAPLASHSAAYQPVYHLGDCLAYLSSFPCELNRSTHGGVPLKLPFSITVEIHRGGLSSSGYLEPRMAATKSPPISNLT